MLVGFIGGTGGMMDKETVVGERRNTNKQGTSIRYTGLSGGGEGRVVAPKTIFNV